MLNPLASIAEIINTVLAQTFRRVDFLQRPAINRTGNASRPIVLDQDGYINDGFIDPLDLNPAAAIHAATAKGSIVDNDEFGIADSASTYTLKKVLWSVIKSVLNTYFLSNTQTLTNKTLTAPVITTPTLTLKQSATPTPTAEGDVQWDTDDNRLAIGDGAATKLFSDDSVTVVHGATGAVVGTTNSQTLTNKTLTSPIIDTPTLTLKQSTNPTPTAEGVVEWDTDDNKLAIGSTTVTKIFSPDDGTATLTNKTISGASNTLTNIGTTSLSNNAVTNAKLASMAANTMKVNNTGSPADPTDADILTLLAGYIHSVSGKTTPIDADKFAIIDTAASNVLKTTTLANLKTLLDARYLRKDVSDQMGTGTKLTLASGGLGFSGANSNDLTEYDEGTWTPTDASGASLSFTSVSGQYTRIGRRVEAEFALTFPSTASGSQVKISTSGLPSTPLSLTSTISGGGYLTSTNYTNAVYISVDTGDFFTIAGVASAAFLTNANLSTLTIRGTLSYNV